MNKLYELSYNEKVLEIKSWFKSCETQDDKYRKIIELGRSKRRMDDAKKTSLNLVEGCQSKMYLHTTVINGRVFFEGEADALISSGLSVLLTHVYSGETPECILKKAPDYLDELEIASSLTPNRANGLYSLHLRMKQEALKALVTQK